MKKILLLFFIVMLTSFSKVEDDVYICGSKVATKYHYSETCRGLNACKHQIVKVTLKEVKNIKLTLCGCED